jgi:hypothetical protein
VNGAHLGRHPLGLHHGDDPIDRRTSEWRHVLAIIDRDIRFAVALVGCERAPRYGRDDLVGDRREPVAMVASRGFVGDKAPLELVRRRVVAHVQRSVLAHDGVDRPHPCDVIAPAGGAAGDRDDELARGPQPLHCAVGFGGQAAVRRQCFVDVGQHAADRPARAVGHAGKRLHHASRATLAT